MSAMGQKRTYLGYRGMSALPSKADIQAANCSVCYVPIADLGKCSPQMDPHRFRLRVVAERLQAFVAAGARLLVAAPGLGHVAMIEAIDPNHTRLEIAARADGGIQVLGPDAGGQTVD